MKNITTHEVVTYLGIAATILLILMYATGCSMKFYKKSPTDVRKCCDRVSAQTEQMATFNRYCKVALFLSQSKNKAVGKVVQKNAAAAVKVCKFVFDVDTDAELVAAGDEQEYHRVRSYIIMNPSEDPSFWRRTLPCDPGESACEEF